MGIFYLNPQRLFILDAGCLRLFIRDTAFITTPAWNPRRLYRVYHMR